MTLILYTDADGELDAAWTLMDSVSATTPPTVRGTRGQVLAATVRGVLLGLGVLFVCYWFVAPAYMRLDFWLYRLDIADIRDLWLGGYSVVAHLVIGGTFSTLAGFVVGVTHRHHRRTVVAVLFGLILLNHSIEWAPAIVSAGLSPRAAEVWTRFLLDLTLIRLPLLVAGVFLVRDRR